MIPPTPPPTPPAPLPPPLPPNVHDLIETLVAAAIEVRNDALVQRVAALEVRNAALEARLACAGFTHRSDGACALVPASPNVTAIKICLSPSCDDAR